MTVADLFSWAAQALLALVATLTLVDFARHRGQARLDIALMFGALGSIVLLQGLAATLRAQAPWLTQLGALLVLSQPYLLLRLARYFRRVPGPVLWAALASVALAWAILILVPAPRPQALTLAVVACFVWVELYAAAAFVRGARRPGGVTRPRLIFAACGSGLLTLTLVLAGLNQVVPANTGLTGPLAGILACGAMLCYSLAFTPPHWLHRSWQLHELQRFLSAMAGQPASQRARVALEGICRAGVSTVGGVLAVVLRWDAASGQLVVEHASDGAPPLGPFSPDERPVGGAWAERRPVVAGSLREMSGRAADAAAAVDAAALIAVPIESPGLAWGVAVVFFHRLPLFVSDDVRILRLLAEQGAFACDYAALLDAQAALVAELRQHSVQLETVNRELETFSYSVAHDLRAPLRSLAGFSQALIEDYADQLGDQGQNYLRRIAAAAGRMGELVDGLLALSRITRGDIRQEEVDLSAIARAVAQELGQREPGRAVDWQIAGGLRATGDVRLMQVLLENLLANAWKFTRPCDGVRIEVGREEGQGGAPVYFVRDNGVGFDMAYAEKLFGVFQRLHAAADFEGTGIGLATVQRIVHRHGGRIWATGAVGEGAAFFFTL